MLKFKIKNMTKNINNLSNDQKNQKIQSLREMISSAESAIHGAKAMLLELEGKRKVGRKKKIDDDTPGYVIHGTFNGQIMTGADGKQYPVPANYASKSKLIEGDLLKLNITPEGNFIYKQVGPAPRLNCIGIVGQDSNGNYFIAIDGKSYKVLLAAVTYFKAEPGDEVAAIISQEEDATWVAIENVLQHSNSISCSVNKETEVIANNSSEELVLEESDENDLVLDEWTPSIDSIEKEIRTEMNV